MCVISLQILTILEEQENEKTLENTEVSRAFDFEFLISSRTVTIDKSRILASFVSYKCHIDTH